MAVEEDDGVALFEKVLGGRGAASACGKVVDEANGLVFERDGGAAGRYEDDATPGGVMVGNKVLDFFGEMGEVGGRGVGLKVEELVGGFNVLCGHDGFVGL